MPPLRRYLRLTPHSVLEVRIYLDNPSAETLRWLTNERTPALPNVIKAVRPLVLPKLREEKERGRGYDFGRGGVRKKKGKGKGVKDIIVTDDFEVSIFLTETSARHSILRKVKTFDSDKPKLQSNSAKLTGASRELPFEVEEDDEGAAAPRLRHEGSDDEGKSLDNIPEANDGEAEDEATGGEDTADQSTWKRRRKARDQGEEEQLFLSDSPSETSAAGMPLPPISKRQKEVQPHRGQFELEQVPGEVDEKKKLALSTTYDGFSIYGLILCLVVTRKGKTKGKTLTEGAGQAMMEEWIASTQVQREVNEDD